MTGLFILSSAWTDREDIRINGSSLGVLERKGLAESKTQDDPDAPFGCRHFWRLTAAGLATRARYERQTDREPRRLIGGESAEVERLRRERDECEAGCKAAQRKLDEAQAQLDAIRAELEEWAGDDAELLDVVTLAKCAACRMQGDETAIHGLRRERDEARAQLARFMPVLRALIRWRGDPLGADAVQAWKAIGLAIDALTPEDRAAIEAS